MQPEASSQPSGLIHTLMIVDQDTTTRLGALIRHLCVGLIDESVQVSMLDLNGRRQIPEGLGPGRLIPLPRGRWPWSRLAASSVLQSLGGQKPGLIHAMSAQLARTVYPWCKAWRTALVVQLTDREDLEDFRQLGQEIPLIGLAAGTHIEQEAIKQQPQRREQIRVVRPGLPAETEPAYRPEEGRVRTALLSTPMVRHNGMDTVLRALKSIVEAGRELQLFILSGGPAESHYRRVIEELGLRPYVTFTGQVIDSTTIRSVLSAADFYIESNPWRRFDTVSLTALVCGLVILAAEPVQEDYLIDGQTAVLFDPHKPRQLADRWISLLADPQAAGRLAYNALEHARRHHQANAMVGGTAGLYRQLYS